MKYPTLLVAALAACITSTATWADPPWARDGGGPPGHAYGWHKHHHHDDDEHEREGPRVVYVQPAPRQAVVVYPPWIVQQQGQYVYQPEYRPVAPPPSMVVNRCNSETVGQVLGGVVGGVLGHQIGGGTGKTLATVGGAVAGVIVGGNIGRQMDAQTQGCVGQVLEVAPVGQRVQWVDSGATYVVVPQKVVMRHGEHCRPYTMQMKVHGGWQNTRGMACRRPGGVWVAA
jgi:surface antigen